MRFLMPLPSTSLIPAATGVYPGIPPVQDPDARPPVPILEVA